MNSTNHTAALALPTASPISAVVKSVLIVDDLPTNLKLLRVVLEAEGLDVHEAADGIEALAVLECVTIDAIISDILMPRMDGYRLCQEVRASAKHRDLPFIFYTATYTSASDENAALGMGADRFLRKPSSAEKLVSTLREVGGGGSRRPVQPFAPEQALALMKEYNERLVAKLEQKNVELAAQVELLGAAEERFRQMAENIDEVFWMTTPDKTQILYVSPGYERIWGRPCAGLYANPRSWLDAIVPTDRARVWEAAAKQPLQSYHETYRIQRPDGSIRWIRDRGFPVRNAQGEVYRLVGVADDITEHKNLEQQFLRTQRMESLGQLAGGIAHDLNNVLAPILMAAPILRAGMAPADVAQTIDTIEKSAERGAALVRQLLYFGRGLDGERVAVRLKDAVREIEEILAPTFPKSIAIRSDVARELWLVSADTTQLQQVLLNLLVNARDAMPAGGELDVAAENIRLDEPTARQLGEGKPGPYVRLRVTDTGTGIAPEIVDKIFDPFFTTKEKGKGTGLGLSTVLGIVKSHGGFITVRSECAHGTTFEVYLPALLDGSDALPAPLADRTPEGRGEEVLIVDDEELIREVLQKAFVQHGYTVSTAADGIDGAALFFQRAQSVKLLVTDLSMPRMGGVAMIQLIQKLNPRLPIIGITGSSGMPDEERGATALRELGVHATLSKPFTMQQVLTAAHAALQAKAA